MLYGKVLSLPIPFFHIILHNYNVNAMLLIIIIPFYYDDDDDDEI